MPKHQKTNQTYSKEYSSEIFLIILVLYFLHFQGYSTVVIIGFDVLFLENSLCCLTNLYNCLCKTNVVVKLITINKLLSRFPKKYDISKTPKYCSTVYINLKGLANAFLFQNVEGKTYISSVCIQRRRARAYEDEDAKQALELIEN